ncbi:zf-PARP-domain-containing protein [Penicillium sp. IBT 35674x]|nr:zf-PARP-domain-containing protein [Penicillium sp. IBT 35674x]
MSVQGEKIPANSLSVGLWIKTKHSGYFRWRHWVCTTPPVIEKLRAQLGPTDKDRDYLSLDGWRDLPKEDQARVREALENVDRDVKKDGSRNRTPRKQSPV